jgi:hypothetical protein
MVTRARPPSGKSTFHGKVEINDHAFKALAQRLRGLKGILHNHRITVGIHEDKGAADKLGYDGKPSGLTVAEVATIQEHGAGSIPARSFVGEWFDERRDHFVDELKQASREELENYRTGQETSPAMAEFGSRSLETMKERIRAGLDPELADATVKARQKHGLPDGPPLIATKQLIGTLSAKVDGREVQE